MIKLIKKIKVYGPEYLGIKDILILDGKIASIGDDLAVNLPQGVEVVVIDGSGMLATPGFVDSHLHMLGGGGEGGFRTRTPEIMLTDLTKAGITTAVGCLGTDGVTRNMMSLLAKARALEEEGISTFIYTGSYRIPVGTITKGVMDDIIAIDKVIGVGEIAISDHRSSQPTFDEFHRVASDSRVGGMLSGKAGVLNIHLGDGGRMIDLILETVEKTEIPKTQFLPTHVNRSKSLFEACITFAKNGGYIDFTGNENSKLAEEEGEVRVDKGIKQLLDLGVSSDNFTISSDAQGSLPIFNEKKELIGLGVGNASCLWKEVRETVENEGVPLEIVLKTITSNPARILKLKNKGRLLEGYDADLCLISEESMEIDTVIAKGNIMCRNKKPVVYGTFEKSIAK